MHSPRKRHVKRRLCTLRPFVVVVVAATSYTGIGALSASLHIRALLRRFTPRASRPLCTSCVVFSSSSFYPRPCSRFSPLFCASLRAFLYRTRFIVFLLWRRRCEEITVFIRRVMSTTKHELYAFRGTWTPREYFSSNNR